MGLFSSIGKVIGKVAKPVAKIAGFASNPVVGLGASALGGLWSAKQARDSAGQQMAFQDSMSSTAYQRAMSDMKEAGLNPMLAYSQGGASTPSGAGYSAPDPITPAINTAMSQQRIKQEVTNMKEQEHSIRANTHKALQEAQRMRLENRAYEQLSPSQRLMFMSANPVASGVSAARGFRGLFGNSAKAVKNLPKISSGKSVRSGNAVLDSVRNLIKRR